MGSDGDIKLVSPTRGAEKRPCSSNSVSPPQKFQIIERYSVPGTTHSDIMPDERAFLSKLHPIQMDLDRIDQDLSFYKRRILSQRTAISAEELHIVKLEEDVNHLSGVLTKMEADVKELDRFTEESMTQIKSNFEIKKKEIQLGHAKKLLDLKENLTNEVEKAVIEAANRQREQKEKLLQEIEELKSKLQLARKEKNKRLIHIKEDHSRAVFDINSEMEDATTESQNALAHWAKEKEAVLEKQTEREQDLAEVKNQISVLEKELAKVREDSAANERSFQLINEDINATIAEMNKLSELDAALVEEIEHYNKESETLRSSFPDLERKRKNLHSTLQELKGNIRVFCRIRPDDSADHAELQCTAPEEIGDNGKQDLVISKSDVTLLWNPSGVSKNDVYSFQFDKIFDQTISNDEIFEEWSQLVQSAVDGSKVCVFAYGQTGSGKTYTMSNSDNGMIPLSMKKIFDELKELESQGWTHKVVGDFIEIYNDSIVDLLSQRPGSKKHDIKHDDASGTTAVTNVVTREIKSCADATALLSQANKNRATASTNANERSSRSHSVFTIKINGENQKTLEKRSGVLNLVDLAGSERLNLSHATGNRLKETQAINRSLSCLGDVIHSLSKKQAGAAAAHVPFRNSKLTYLLKHSLQGDSKTLMFVNISPLQKNMSETINSLRFASKVNNTKLA